MQNAAVSLALALALAAVLLVFVRTPSVTDGETGAATELAALRRELAHTSHALQVLNEKLAALERERSRMPPAVVEAEDRAVPREAPPAGAMQEAAAAGDVLPPPPEVLRPYEEQTRDYVFALIDEKRRLENEERLQQAEARRREHEELSQGPYGNFNLKVNSMAKLLEMPGAQRDRYHEISARHWEKLQELRKGINWSEPGARQNYHAEHERIEAQFAEDVAQILSIDQLAVYEKLPAWTRRASHLGPVHAGNEPQVLVRHGSADLRVDIQAGTLQVK